MKKILVVVDMQKDFVDGTLGSEQAVAIVPNVARKIKEYQANGDAIYFTKDTHEANYLSTQEGQNLPVVHCVRGTQGWAFTPEVEQLAGELTAERGEGIIFEKGVFGSEKLAQILRERAEGEDEVAIELVGLCTDICVLSNAIVIKTYLPEAVITVDAACCAGVTPQTHHNALEAMKLCQIQVIHQ